MKMSARAVIGLAGAALCLGALGACTAPTTAVGDIQERVKTATAAAVGNGAQPKDIVISDLQTTPARTQWRAVVGASTFACDADDKLSLPDCHPAK